MRIAIDARELTGQPTGVGRYLRGILTAWNAIPAAAAHEYVLCTSSAFHDPALTNLPLSYATGRWAVDGTVWEQFALPGLASGANVLFAPGYTAPVLGSTPTVVTVHDVSFSAHPGWFSWREGWRRRVLTGISARRAARVITVSDFSKREIVRHLNVPPAQVEVIYSGAAAMTVERPPEAGDDPLVLYVGSLFNRRHVPELVEGFARFAGRRHTGRLEIVGDNRTRPHVDVDDLIARSAARDRIHARSYVADEELMALYRRASAFVFLSEYEGFALTPMEALAAGVPIILLDTEVAREIYGPAAVYLRSPDPELLAAALERVLSDGAERARLLQAASTQLQRYSWHECARRTLQVLLACARA